MYRDPAPLSETQQGKEKMSISSCVRAGGEGGRSRLEPWVQRSRRRNVQEFGNLVVKGTINSKAMKTENPRKWGGENFMKAREPVKLE